MNDNKKHEKLFEDLKKRHPIDEMVKFSELDIAEKLQENTELIVRYRDFYHKSLAELDRLNDLLEKLSGIRFKYYRFDCSEKWTKPEIEKYCLPADEKITKMKKIVRRQEIKVRYYEMCWKAFEKQQWSMKLFMETLKGY
jgi:hypothetical protein